MPTIFENIRMNEAGTEGQIKTISTFSIWKCKEKRWSLGPSVVLRNTMLGALHPYKEFCIGEISKTDTNAALLNPFKPKDCEEPFFLDLAS
ncbi:MAG: hypothetical protein ACKPH7_30360, partial [Planktothrix sp.]